MRRQKNSEAARCKLREEPLNVTCFEYRMYVKKELFIKYEIEYKI